jgi:hypothetical protein
VPVGSIQDDSSSSRKELDETDRSAFGVGLGISRPRFATKLMPDHLLHHLYTRLKFGINGIANSAIVRPGGTKT